MKLVQNLCPFLCEQSGPLGSLGFSLDAKGRLYGTYEPPCQPVCPSKHLVSLEDLLSKSTSSNKRRAPSDEDRYLLVVILASSLLQLHAMPWLREPWSKRDILFSDNLENDDESAINVRHPVILTTYGCVAPESLGTKPATDTQACLNLMKDSASLLALAKVLLEIKLNGHFDMQQQQEDLGTDTRPNEATEIHMLMRWMTEEKGNLSFTYRDVVSYYIKCSVDPRTDLGNVIFRQTLIDKIVVPLLEELHF